MKKPTCPNCQRTLSIKDYLRTAFQRYFNCPACQSNIEWDDVKNWHIYLYYNVFILIILMGGIIERHFKIPHLTDLIASICFFGTILGGYYLYHPKGITTHSNSKKDNFKFIARLGGRILSIFLLTSIQDVLIFLGLYKIFEKGSGLP